MTDLSELIERVEKATGPSNELDIQIEIALFDPEVSVRPNAAGTKLIYAMRSGKQQTVLAADHTLTPESREIALALLRSLQHQEPRDDR
jgi:hypothetical protein